MNNAELELSRNAYDGFVSITTNEAAFRLFGQAGEVARGMGHFNIDPIHVVIAALQAPNVFWRFVRQVTPLTYADAVQAAEMHYDGPKMVADSRPVITQFTPPMQHVAARLHTKQSEWISERLASHNGADTVIWEVRDMLLTFCAESDSPAVKALELQTSTSSV
jgi:hypothetical protein